MSSRLFMPVILFVGIMSATSIYRVNQWEQAIVFKFREIEYSTSQPGLHFMIPFVNTTQKFETRLLNFDQEPQRFLTSEKKDVIVDYFVKWRISDVEKFYTATGGGNIEAANVLLGQQINNALRDEFGKRTVQEVVAGVRGEIMDFVKPTTEKVQNELGIDVVDVRTKRIDLPEEISTPVYERMRSERTRVAKDLRARGGEASERIKANADREREIILANAYKDAETIRGEGDAHATEIYASAYGKNPEFYSFYRSLNAYQNSFKSNNDILLLKPDSDFFKYFRGQQGR